VIVYLTDCRGRKITGTGNESEGLQQGWPSAGKEKEKEKKRKEKNQKKREEEKEQKKYIIYSLREYIRQGLTPLLGVNFF